MIHISRPRPLVPAMITVFTLLAGCQGAPQKSMLLTEPGATKIVAAGESGHGDYGATGLIDFATVSIKCDSVPEPLRKMVSAAELEKWATDRLASLGIEVISEEEQNRRLFASKEMTEEAALRRRDECYSRFDVMLRAFQHEDSHTTVYEVGFSASRGSFVYPGAFIRTMVWQRTDLGWVSETMDRKAALLRRFNHVFSEFESDWKIANGR